MFAYREEGYLVIKIPEENLINGVSLIPESPQFKVTDKDEFLDFCKDQICEFGDSGDFGSCSKLTALIDELLEEAVELAAGIEQNY